MIGLVIQKYEIYPRLMDSKKQDKNLPVKASKHLHFNIEMYAFALSCMYMTVSAFNH
jgi:hypothetical protein